MPIPPRKIMTIVLTIVALLLLGDTIRLFVMPSQDSQTITADGVSLSLALSSRYVLRPGDCVDIEWSATGAELLVIGSGQVPASGAGRFCPQIGLQGVDTSPIPAEIPVSSTWTNQDPSLTAYFNEGREYLNLRLPVYILLADWLWMWRVVLAALALTAVYALFKPIHLRRLSRRGLYPFVICMASAVLLLIGIEALQIVLYQRAIGFDFGTSTLDIRFGMVLLTVLNVLVYVLTMHLTGYALFRQLIQREVSPFTRLCSSFLLGLGTYALLWIVLGILGVFWPTYIRYGLLAGLLLGLVSYRTEFWHDLQNAVSVLWEQYSALDKAWRVLIWMAAVFVLMLTTRSLIVGSIDGPITYLLNAKMFAVSGQMQPISDGSLYYYTLSGQIGEAHMAALLSIANETAARLLMWFVLLNVLVICIQIGLRMGLKQQGALLLLLMLLTTSALTNLGGDGKIDLLGIAFSVAAIYWVLDLEEENLDFRELAIIGLFCGWSVLAKITSGPSLGLFVILLVAYFYRKQPRNILVAWLVIGLAGLVPVVFHIARNGLMIGEPLVPFVVRSKEVLAFTSTFDLPWTDPRIIRYFRTIYPIAATYPLHVLVYGTLTPLWLGLLPLLVWTYRPSRRMLVPVVIATIAVALWIGFVPTVREIRYVLPLLLLMFIPVAAIMDTTYASSQPNGLLRTILLFMIGLLLIWRILMTGFAFVSDVIFNDADLDCLSVNCKVYEVINSEEPPAGTRVFSNERADYFLRDDMLQCNTTRSERSELSGAVHVERWELLYSRGFDYAIDAQPDDIVRNKAVNQLYKKMVPLNPDLTPDWLTVNQIGSMSVGSGEAFTIYRLEAGSGAPARTVACERNQQGRWELIEIGS